MASSLLTTTANAITDDSSGEAVFNAFKESGILPTTATKTNWSVAVLANSGELQDQTFGNLLKQMLQTNNPNDLSRIVQQFNRMVDTYQLPDSLKIFAQQNTVSSADIKEFHLNLVKALSVSEGNLSSQMRTQLFSLFGLQDGGEVSTAKLHQLLQLFQNSQETGIKPFLQQAVQLSENTLDGKAFETAMKTMLRNMGFGYEHMLSGKAVEPQLLDQLKPQLLTVIQHPAASAQLKENAEQLIQRLNGVQILSAESGHQQQIVMQIPLQFLGRKMDATLNWTGRMKEDGKIDSDYVRVLFYLQLSSLKETVIDMAVQNRVVTINVYNEEEGLTRLAEPFKEALKEGLASVDYRLSGVSLKTLAEQSNVPKKTVSTPSKGVDIRI